MAAKRKSKKDMTARDLAESISRAPFEVVANLPKALLDVSPGVADYLATELGKLIPAADPVASRATSTATASSGESGNRIARVLENDRETTRKAVGTSKEE